MLSQAVHVAATSDLSWLESNLQWGIAGLIVLAGLVIYGGADLLRFSVTRVRAVAQVCFDESIRRRVLWLTPLAILGVIIVSQFQRPLDEQDAIRQVTKFCLFACGLLVTIASIILACTNLPKEIDNRVIFTVVTKPTTRLEILLGKIAGFAAVSASILLIMGLFTWGYLHYREWQILSDVKTVLASPEMTRDSAAKQNLQYYAANGLLDARYLIDPQDIQIWSSYAPASQPIRWMSGEGEQTAYIPFKVDSSIADQLPANGVGMLLQIHLPWRQRTLTADETKSAIQLAEAAQVQMDSKGIAPAGPGMGEAGDAAKLLPAFVRVDFDSPAFVPLVDSTQISDSKPVVAADRTGQRVIQLPIRGDIAARVIRGGQFYVGVTGLSPGTQYAVTDGMATLTLPSQDPQKPQIVHAEQFDPSVATPIVIHGRTGTNGQQLKGEGEGQGGEGVVAFRKAPVPADARGKISFEIRSTVEVNDTGLEEEPNTHVQVRVANLANGKISDPITFPLETRRTAHFQVSKEFAEGGNFDVLVKCTSGGHWLSLGQGAVRMASRDMGFGMNLFKGLFILWLFSVLVVAVAIFCSTFLSWPIAIVLTLLILLGNWGVTQLNDMLNPGVGRQVVGDLFAGAAPAVNETLVRSLEGLTSLLRGLSLILPDISSFGTMEDLERGNWITLARLLMPLKVLVVFGLPTLTLSYVFFRNKEVAP